MLTAHSLDQLHDCYLQSPFWRQRCAKRWSCTNPSNNYQDDRWRCMWEAPIASCMLQWAASYSEYPICIGSSGGDFVEPGALAQGLHTDWVEYSVRSMKWGFILAISVAVTDHEENGGLIRIVSWSNFETHKYPQLPSESPDLCKSLQMKRGEMLIRDVRACHGGSAHSGLFGRPLPSVQAYCTPCCRGKCFKHACIDCSPATFPCARL